MIPDWRAYLASALVTTEVGSMQHDELESVRLGVEGEIARLREDRRDVAETCGTLAAAFAKIRTACQLPETAPIDEVVDKAVRLLGSHPWFLRPQELVPADWRRYVASTVRDERALCAILAGIANEIQDIRDGVPPQVAAGSIEEARIALDRVRASFSLMPWADPADIAAEAERRALDLGAASRELGERLRSHPVPEIAPEAFVDWVRNRTTPEQQADLAARLGSVRLPSVPDLKLYRYRKYCGRMGTLHGMFAVDGYGEECVRALITSERSVYFGEVLGKHSQIEVTVEADDLERIAASPSEIATTFRILGCGLRGPVAVIDGFCPLRCEGSGEVRDEHLLDWCRGVPPEELDEVAVDAG